MAMHVSVLSPGVHSGRRTRTTTRIPAPVQKVKQTRMASVPVHRLAATTPLKEKAAASAKPPVPNSTRTTSPAPVATELHSALTALNVNAPCLPTRNTPRTRALTSTLAHAPATSQRTTTACALLARQHVAKTPTPTAEAVNARPLAQCTRRATRAASVQRGLHSTTLARNVSARLQLAGSSQRTI